MSICVCAKCNKPWKASGSPASCPHCGQVSFAIAIQMGSQATAAKKRGQNPRYRAKQSVAHIGKHHTAETKAKISAAITRWHDKKRGVAMPGKW